MLLAILPARGGSQRIKSKNIVDFCGKPLISYSLQAAKDSGIFDEIHVSTDSDEIAEVVSGLGFPVEFMRNSDLADSHTPLLPVLSWVLAEFEKRGRAYSDVCQIMPTAPLIQSEDLKKAYSLFKERQKIHPLIAMSPFPAPVDWAMEINDQCCTVAREPEKLLLRSQDLVPTFYDSGAFVFYSAAQIKNPDFSGSYLAYQLPKARSVDIDDQEDLEMAEILFRGWQEKRGA